MLTELRSGVAELLRGAGLGVDVWEYVPGDVAAYPCIVVGRANAFPADASGVVFNVNCDVHVCGHPQSDDAQDQLDKLADQTWITLGGTRVRSHAELRLIVTAVQQEVITIAGDSSIPAYAITVENSIATC